MGAIASDLTTAAPSGRPARPTTEPAWFRWTAIAVVLAFLGLFLVAPLVIVFAEAFSKGARVFVDSFRDPAALHAVQLTLTVAAVALPLNTAFGIAAAWALTRHTFPGRRLLITLVELPLWVSPVIGGLVFVLIFGAQGWMGEWLIERDIRVLYALPGILLGTLFVTFPFVARGLIPLMQQQGMAEEEAALTLGANGWRLFLRVTLPKIKWGLLYGMILCNARAMGEFGAVSVLSGHIRGQTNTMPLHIEILYNEYQFAAAFAMASLLSILALLTLVLKAWVERSARANTSV